MMMPKKNLYDGVALFRRFNRFYTKQIGLLTKGLLKTRFPLTQARVLYELAQRTRLLPAHSSTNSTSIPAISVAS